MNSTAKWLVGALALSASALLGYWVPRAPRPEPTLGKELAAQRALLTSLDEKLKTLSRPPMAGSTTVVGAACDTVALKAEVESSVRDALVADRQEAEEAAKDHAVAPNSEEIYAKAELWINAKLESKHWSPADFGELARASLGLPDEQRRELRHRVLRAVNSGEFDTSRYE